MPPRCHPPHTSPSSTGTTALAPRMRRPDACTCTSAGASSRCHVIESRDRPRRHPPCHPGSAVTSGSAASSAPPPPPFSEAGLRDALSGAFADFDWWLRAHARPVSGVLSSAGSSRSEALASRSGGSGVTAGGDGGYAGGQPEDALRERAGPRPAGMPEDDGDEDEDDPAAMSAGEASIGGGTTALVCLVCEEKLHLAHCGDSRAVLCTTGRPATRLTADHTPNLPAEAERISALGGFVSRGRVHGILAVSRALGDLELQPFISPEPDVSVVPIPPPAEAPSVLILASDGLWGLVEDDDAAAIALPTRPTRRLPQMP